MTRGLKFIPILLLLSPACLAQASMYCGSSLIRQGDPIYQVARRCPEPFWTERWQQPLTYGHHGYPYGVAADAIEVWYLNFGQRRMMRRLSFRNGYLARLESLDYGVAHEPGARRCDAYELTRVGRSAGEVYARCGEPDYRYDFSATIGPYYGGPWPLPAGARREIWAYDMGPGRLIRELFFVDGQLIHARSEPR